MQTEREKLANAYRTFEQLLERSRGLMLATNSAANLPGASYAPFTRDKSGIFHVFLSGLSGHTTNLIETPITSILIMDEETETMQAFARVRLSFLCDVGIVTVDDEAYGNILDQFKERFGEVIDLLRSLPDFVLFSLKPRSGRFIMGFGQAYDVSGDQFDRLEHVGPDQITAARSNTESKE